MKLKPRASNNPKRRFVNVGTLSGHDLIELQESVKYVGSAYHKRFPSDYGFTPPTAPRPHKSLCDRQGAISLAEARILVRTGLAKAMFSPPNADGLPKYIWAVLDNVRPFEANLGGDSYHGYELESDDPMHELVLVEWRKRADVTDN